MDLSLLLEPSVLTELLVQGLVRGAMYALMAAGLAVIFGILGVANFAHGELFMIGSYVMVFAGVSLGLPFVIGIGAAVLGLFAIGFALERTLIETLRRRAGRDWLLDSFVLTIGLMVVLQNLALIAFGSRRRGISQLIDGSLEIGTVIVSYERLFILAAAGLAGLALWAATRYSAFGKALRATAQNPEAAQTLGIDIAKIYSASFGLGAALAGLAGALLISIYPAYPTVGSQPVIKGLAVVILGGLGHVPGAVIGGLLLGVLEAYSLFYMSAGWQNVMTAGLVVLVLILRPSGLFAPAGGDRP
jgi:branched-chain amino acid transport system permease protein